MDYQELVAMAFEARKNSYSPYSHFQVGAALLAEDGRVFTGCNVENCAYSAGCCAERNAIFKAVSEGVKKFQALAVVGGPAGEADVLSQTATPCGMCRQVISEFTDGSLPIIMATSRDAYEVCTLKELLPRAFTPESL